MDGESNGAHGHGPHGPHGHGPLGHAPGQLVGSWWSPATTDVMSQLCRVCGEPAAGFHFGAFTCEGCKSFFGRTYNNLGSITECKNQGTCVINKKNRTSCKACRLRKCLMVGMSKSGSRYGRRSNWFKIHCLLQEQQHQQQQHHHQHHQQQPPQQVPLPPASPSEKSPKGDPGPGVGPHRGPRGVGLGPEGLYGHATAMLWGPGGPRSLLPLPPPPPHGAHLPLPFPPFLPAAAAAAAAALNGSVPPSLFGVPPPGGPRHEWSRLASPLSSGSASPPVSPRPRGHHKAVVAPPGPPPPRTPPSSHRRLSSPRIDVDGYADPDAEQEQPMDLSRTAACANHNHNARRHASASPPPAIALAVAPFAQDLGRDADGEDNCDGEDKDGSDSGVSERESDRVVDGDAEGERRAARRGSPGPRSAPVPVDLSARLSC